jgi:hypothetical protein
MKNVFIGLILGIALCGLLGWFLAVPGIKQAAYDAGFEAGNQKGISTGIATGIAEEKATQKRISDSLTAAAEAERTAAQKKKPKPQKIEQPIQNWRVIGGKIAEPIPDEPEKVKEK